MAAFAPADDVLIAAVLFAFEVTEETRIERDNQMLSLDDLGVTRDAAQLLPAARLSQMRPMIEADRHVLAGDALDGPIHLSFKQSLLVAARSHAGNIAHFGMWLGAVGLRDVLDGLAARLEFAVEGLLQPRLAMAIGAGPILVPRAMPRLGIRVHQMTGPAEVRLPRILQEHTPPNPADA